MICPMILASCPWETIPVVSFIHYSIKGLSAFNSLNAIIYSVFAFWGAKGIINDCLISESDVALLRGSLNLYKELVKVSAEPSVTLVNELDFYPDLQSLPKLLMP